MSPLTRRVPSGRSSSPRAAFSSATASTVPKCSRWLRPTKVRMPKSGSTRRVRLRISPGWLVPTSKTPARLSRSSCSRERGTPTSLLKLAGLAATFPSGERRVRRNSRVVVLPLDPVMATTGRPKRRRQARASLPRALRVSSTSTWGREPSPGGRSTSEAAARRPMEASRKSWASKRSPLSATNRSPSSTLRESVQIRRTRSPGPAWRSRPPVARATKPSSMGSLIPPCRPPSLRARAAPAPSGRRTGPRRERWPLQSPGWSRGPFRR